MVRRGHNHRRLLLDRGGVYRPSPRLLGGGMMNDKQQRELRTVIVILLVSLVIIAAVIAAAICLPDQWPTKPQPQPLVTG